MKRFVPRIIVTNIALLVGFAFASRPASARFITMPPTARSWLDIRNNPAGVELDPVTGTPIGDSVGQFLGTETPLPLAEYQNTLPLMAGNAYSNLHLTAAGSVDGNTLRSYASGLGGTGVGFTPGHTPAMTMFNSANDTYTLTGTPGQVGQSVSLTVHFDVSGTASLFGQLIPTSDLAGQVFITAKMGTFNPVLSPSLFDREDLRVSQFDSSTNATFDLRRINAASVNGIVDLHLSHTFTAVVGTPFDTAYEIRIAAFDRFATFNGGTDGFTADLSHSGVISFDIPSGLALTSVNGFSSAVPEPSSFVALGASAVVLATRRRAKRAGSRLQRCLPLQPRI
jgi:hypothetical protein